MYESSKRASLCLGFVSLTWLAGCGDGSSVSVAKAKAQATTQGATVSGQIDGPEDGPTTLDQVVPVGDVGAAGPPAVSREDSTNIATPGTKSMQVRITNLVGPGCARGTELVDPDASDAHNVRLQFKNDDFVISLPRNNRGASASLNCMLELRVRGIKDHEVVSTHLVYGGDRDLPFDAVAHVTSRVMWRDAEFSSYGATKTGEFFDTVGAWRLEHPMLATDRGVRSRCFTSDQEEDVFYVDISMHVHNGGDEPAKMNMTWTSANANGRASTQQPPVAAQLQAVRCRS